ncbi:Similar to S.cerevisiae protein THG1 (tRNAHis guanylyltransferase) [Malassezia sympodialis ATCC 42132]|uniref:tRNA(His) guanylyltransferase n=1 Tax=Malassezia sympodialis (strain ATCC 42132) TaxID=1230383 RepID=A0A1M8AC30_MALS4|nr:Similar to S.cerevisiae protein THG1 (tRNAHis guanylyltransferase) [Malassezia sympodialis ATCC 42132]
MAGSRYAYVRDFELADVALPRTFLVVRIDGKGFHKFSHQHGFSKPNDANALELMNEAARHVMREFKGHITLAFGESDEYSFLIDRDSGLYNRRQSKLISHIVSLFTSAYVFAWRRYMDVSLQYPPSFDGRLVMYPTHKEVRDYFAWRQADTHINNLYNTVFWALVLQGGKSEREAHDTLKGTVSAEKHEIMFQQFGINYDKLPAFFRKGTTLVWSPIPDPHRAKPRTELRTLHVDIIGDTFWTPHSEKQPPAAADEVAPYYDNPKRLCGEGLGSHLGL